MEIKLGVTYRNRLRAIMADEGFRSMDSLAEETGISKNMLYLFERGESHLSIPNLIRILWALDCAFDELIQYEVQSNEPTHYHDLNDEVKAAFEAVQNADPQMPSQPTGRPRIRQSKSAPKAARLTLKKQG